MARFNTCKTCRFWQPDEDSLVIGECRRHHPAAHVTSVVDGKHEMETAWPETLDSEWCGEWEFNECREKA